MKNELDRRAFLKLVLVSILSFIQACRAFFASSGSRGAPTAKITRPEKETRFAHAEERQPRASETRRDNTHVAAERKLSGINFAVIHHSQSAGAKNMDELVSKARGYNKQHSFRDYDYDGINDAQFTSGKLKYKWISYHFLIARNGDTLPVQEPIFTRIHCNNDRINATSIAICLDGDFLDIDEYPDGKHESPTEEQLVAAACVIRNWKKENGVLLTVRSHREVSLDTKIICPGNGIGDSTNNKSNLSHIIKLAKSAD